MHTTSGHVAQNQEQLERLRRLVARLGDDDLKRELPDGWTVGDALNQVKLERADHRRSHLDDIESLLGST